MYEVANSPFSPTFDIVSLFNLLFRAGLQSHLVAVALIYIPPALLPAPSFSYLDPSWECNLVSFSRDK